MKRLLLIVGLVLSFSMWASAAWTWEDSSNVENSGLFDQIKNANYASDYCPEADSDLQDRYCVEVDGWSDVSLEDNSDQDGLNNILRIYTELSDNGNLDNDEISALLRIYTCFNEETADTIGSCVGQDFDFSVFSSVNPSELRLSNSGQNGDDESNYDGGDSNNNDESDDDQDSEHTHEFGDIYFYDTEENDKLVRTDAENNYQDEKLVYDMYDRDIVGAIEYHNREGGLDTLWIKNQHTGEIDEQYGNTEYLSIPSDSGTWGTDRSGLYDMDETGCTDFSVAVLPEATADPETEALQGPTEFTFCPNNREDVDQDSEEENSVSKSSGGYTFEVTPPPNDIATDDDVSLTVTESGEDADLSNKRIKFALNGIAGYLPNDPYTTVECSDSECSATITSDRIEGEPGTVDARVDERRRTQTGYDWRPSESVSWDVD